MRGIVDRRQRSRWKLRKADLFTLFLNSDLNEEIDQSGGAQIQQADDDAHERQESKHDQ